MEKTGLSHTDELVRRAVIGDGRAFTALWDENIDAVKLYLRNMDSSMDDFLLDDICSRSFEKAFRQIGVFDPSVAQFKTWLARIARNTAIDVLQKERRKGAQVQSIDHDDIGPAASIPSPQDSPIDVIIMNEIQDKAASSIEGLPEKYRDVARMRLIDGMQYEEIADELELPLNTVRTRIRRAKQLLDQKMNESENE